jgi:hypothetical protein
VVCKVHDLELAREFDSILALANFLPLNLFCQKVL